MRKLLKGRERPAMFLIAGCFCISALLRFATPENAIATELAGMTKGGKHETAANEQGASSAELADLIRTLREREQQLDKRTTRLAEKERIIEAAEKKLRDQLARLEEAEERLADTLRIADKAADKDVAKLVSAFETMKPKAAAPIIENMDTSFAAGLISRMRGQSAADILANLSADKAYAISVHIAGQNARAPTE